MLYIFIRQDLQDYQDFLGLANLYPVHPVDPVRKWTIYAIEIKATKKPGPKDLRHLRQFGDRLNRPVRRFLFYLGEEYSTVDNVNLIPVGALFRGG